MVSYKSKAPTIVGENSTFELVAGTCYRLKLLLYAVAENLVWVGFVNLAFQRHA